jgi:hypothetical protein
MKGKIEFIVKMWDPSENQNSEKIEAATANQALMLAMSKPLNARYIHFGLVGRDGNVHVWRHRNGVPRVRPGGMHSLATPLETARTKEGPRPRSQSAPAVSKVIAAPIVMAPLSIEVLTEMVMTRALPQMPATEAFMARAIGDKLPLDHRHEWTPAIWPHVISRLRTAGVLIKMGNRPAYMRNPEYVSKKMVREEEPAPPAIPVVNGHGTAPAVPAQPSAAPEIALPPKSPDLGQLILTPDDKIDALLMMMRVLLSDTRERESKFKALTDRIMDALLLVDGIRTELESIMKAEAQLPARAGEIIAGLRRSAVVQPKLSS